MIFRFSVCAIMLALLPGISCAQPPAPAASAPPAAVVEPPPLFTDKERTAIVSYWNKPGRYTITAPPDATVEGPYRVRLTPDGSQWFWNYQRTIAGKSKLPPTVDFKPNGGPYAEWEKWVQNRLAYDRAVAQQTADLMNAAFVTVKAPSTPRPLLASRAGKRVAKPSTGDDASAQPADTLPTAPGPIPAGLLAACGNPPAFASVVTPMQYAVQFDEADDTYTYVDNVRLRERYAYYRFPRGVVSYGVRLKDMPASERDELFRAAGFSPAEQRIFSAVSKLEGGFETVQTYDTGFVSVGFIQFVTLAEGKHDLSEVLQTFKENRPAEYQKDFRRFGIDVAPDKTLTVIDPSTGAELTGNTAVMKIIDDKRLTAVFQRAGRRPGFRIAQIKVAKSFYWPSDDMINATLADGTILSGKVCDCIKSEAGLACLLDRKINTGNIRLVNDVALRVASAHSCKTIADLSLYEQEIVAALKYREDFLADATLGQPAPPPKPMPADPKLIPADMPGVVTAVPAAPSEPATPTKADTTKKTPKRR